MLSKKNIIIRCASEGIFILLLLESSPGFLAGWGSGVVFKTGRLRFFVLIHESVFFCFLQEKFLESNAALKFFRFGFVVRETVDERLTNIIQNFLQNFEKKKQIKLQWELEFRTFKF